MQRKVCQEWRLTLVISFNRQTETTAEEWLFIQKKNIICKVPDISGNKIIATQGTYVIRNGHFVVWKFARSQLKCKKVLRMLKTAKHCIKDQVDILLLMKKPFFSFLSSKTGNAEICYWKPVLNKNLKLTIKVGGECYTKMDVVFYRVHEWNRQRMIGGRWLTDGAEACVYVWTLRKQQLMWWNTNIKLFICFDFGSLEDDWCYFR